MLLKAARGLRFMDERVPGVSVPPETIERIEQADDEAEAAYELALEQARQALALPGVRGLHLTDFRRDGALSRSAATSASRARRREKRMHTVLSSPSREVVIGPDRPFCIIGERINPTGRKAFAEALRAGDLSQIVKDVEEQAAMGAHVLDVNMGVPLTDEADLLSRAITLVQEHTDLPICIDSSIVEALEAGLAVVRRQGARELGHLRARSARARAAARQAARRRRHLPHERRDRDPPDGGRARSRSASASSRSSTATTRSRSRTWSSTRSP